MARDDVGNPGEDSVTESKGKCSRRSKWSTVSNAAETAREMKPEHFVGL